MWAYKIFALFIIILFIYAIHLVIEETRKINNI
jgi:hypothetical protein